jgi:hypothetical protein
MNCPSCQSDNTQRLQVVYQHGTQDIATESVTFGTLGTSGGGGSSGMEATTRTTGRSQSILAKKAEPPAKMSYKWPLFILVIGLIGRNHGLSQWLPWLFVGGGIYLLYRAIRYNFRTWPSHYQEWKTGWVCHKCGNIYYQAPTQS